MSEQPVYQDTEHPWPCYCFAFEDDSTGEETCLCSHMLDEHVELGVKNGCCLVNHVSGCRLDHGEDPCDTGLLLDG